MRNRILLVVLLLAVGGLAFYEGYSRSENKYKDDYTRGYSEGKAANAWAIDKMVAMQSDFSDLEKKHNGLIEDYNQLVKYANTPQYQPRQPITCNSYSYGMNSSSTTCY